MTKVPRGTQTRRRGKKGKRQRERERGREKRSGQVFPATSKRAGTHQ